MKKRLFITSSVLLLMAMALVSGCTQQSKNIGTDYYADDLYKMVQKTSHDKHFPHGHEKKAEGKEYKNCYYNEGTSAYFCQYWEDWE